MACIDVSSLVLLTGDECSILFGESKYNLLDKWPPIAKRRGTPPNMFYATNQAVKEAVQHDSTIMSAWGFTYISYDEIKLIDWQSYSGAQLLDLNESYSWGLLFKLMKTLDNASKHQRLIIWFEWR